MEKVFINKKFAYVIITILLALQLTQSIANWCGGGFNGGSLILCILMLVLLVLVGIGVSKKNTLLTIVSGVVILGVLIYIMVNEYSGMIQQCIDGKISIIGLVPAIFSCFGTLLLLGSLVLMILRTFKITGNLKTINATFSIFAVAMFLVTTIIGLSSGFISDSQFSVYQKVYSIVRDFFAIFSALLVGCVGYQLEIKE